MKIKVSDYIADFFYAQGLSHAFEMTGGMTIHLLDALYSRGAIKIISMHHEQAAAFSADAYGRLSGRAGLALASSGPGATNLLTGIASCYFDSSPAIFITGQVSTHEHKGSSGVRQLGFQETDIVSMATPITKQCYKIESADQIVCTLEEAYKLSISGRPGPVLIDIPINFQLMEIEAAPPHTISPIPPVLSASSIENSHRLLEALSKAKKPLILAGGGINCAHAKQAFQAFAQAMGVPVVASLMGLDTLPYHHPLRVGFIGSYGNRWANLVLGDCDVLVVLGSRLDIRQTGSDVKSFSMNKTVFHVDCDFFEINHRVKGCFPIVSDLNVFFDWVSRTKSDYPLPNYHEWMQTIKHLKDTWPDTKELPEKPGINPNIFFHALAISSQEAQGYLVDVGSHQMWAAQSLELTSQQFFLTSGGLGAMGFSLPAAISASLFLNKKPIVVIVGDGALQVNIQELQTVVRNQIPLKIIVLNNQSLGMVTQCQDANLGPRYQSSYWGYSAPDFCAVAKAYGIQARHLRNQEDVEKALDWLWLDPNMPALLEVMIPLHTPVYPIIIPGKCITEMQMHTQLGSVKTQPIL